MLRTNGMRWGARGLALATALLLTYAESAAAAPLDGEIVKITPKRTGFLIDLQGDVQLEPGAKVDVTIDGKHRTGTVKKVMENGRAFVILNKGLPQAVQIGDKIKLEATSGTSESGAEAKPEAVQLEKGGTAKAYWDEVSFLAAHRKAGARTDVDLSYLSATGNSKASGGAAGDNIDFAVTEKTTNLRADAGFVGQGGFGGGLLLTYNSAVRDDTAGNITTTSTSTTDSDEYKTTSKVTDIEPYIEMLSRVKTGDVGFGFGLGIPIEQRSDERAVTIASDTTDPGAAKTTAYGLALEGLVSSNAWALVLQLTPYLSGTIKSPGAPDATHKSFQLGAQVETYAKSYKTRFGIVYASSKDSYTVNPLTETSWKLTARLDYGLHSVHLVPYLDYESMKRSTTGDSLTYGETDIGLRAALAGEYAPFIALGGNIKSENETMDGGHTAKSAISGLKLGAGIDI